MNTRPGIVEIDCAQVRTLLLDYFGDPGEATIELREAIDHHLAKCQPCHAVYDGVRNLIRIMGDERAFAVPEGFSERLHARLAAEIAAQ
jgi:predicted anti-sigma-YlaC factor YlaD